MRKQTFDEVKKRWFDIHGNKYDYSCVDYKDADTKVEIICARGHHFWQTPRRHYGGQGCPLCCRNPKTLIWGRGFNDTEYGRRNSAALKIWYGMFTRCYNPNYHAVEPTYKDACVCEEWWTASNFKKWFDENYVEGYQLDKDILVKGNKVYGPNTCCFVP